jgi:NAD(P)-dependent dehydrogenase (short-subunit alcohol dehydrogenase family)
MTNSIGISAAAALAQWRERIRVLSAPGQSSRTAQQARSDLKLELEALEAERNRVRQEIAALQSQAAAAFSNWNFTAPRPEASIRQFVREQEDLFQRIEEMDVDATVLSALIHDCREVLTRSPGAADDA